MLTQGDINVFEMIHKSVFTMFSTFILSTSIVFACVIIFHQVTHKANLPKYRGQGELRAML